jgi:gas vesicle protein
MKTIRHNVFETNSSSEHVVTILSDKEYKNIENGKAALDYRGSYIDLNKDALKNLIKEAIEDTEKDIEHIKSDIEEYSALENTDTGDWTTHQTYYISDDYSDSVKGAELKKKLKEKLTKWKSDIQESLEYIENLKKIDIIHLGSLIETTVKNLSSLEELFENASYDEVNLSNALASLKDKLVEDNLSFSDTEIKFISSKITEWDNIETFGDDYEESGNDERTIDGVTVHVLSYSGYCD